jgi:(p)ppGpp synthase/HD superfamily hydrolase
MKTKETNKHDHGTTDNKTTVSAKQRLETPEQWWARLGPIQRAFAHEIARLVDEVTDSKRIEIRREREEIRARFIHILKRPESGCVSAIVLPEVPAGWN